jgi:uncharacterized membrane protein
LSIIGLGAVLILIGVVLIAFQFQHELSHDVVAASRSLAIDPQTGRLELMTTYVGLVVVAIGAALVIVGFVATTPWRKSSKQ